jgi:hypothetical protein
MRTSRKLGPLPGLTIALLAVGAAVQAHAVPIPILGNVFEGSTLTINGITITNPNPFAVTLTTLDPAISNPNVMGDSGDEVTSLKFADNGGTCLTILAKNGAFAANAACTVNLTFTTPPADTGEPVDFGLSEITISYRLDNGPIQTNVFDVQVNDVPVPEPSPATMVGLGIVILLSMYCLRRQTHRFAGSASPEVTG